MTTPDKEEMPTNHRNAGPCLREALALVAGGFEGEGLEIENEWRRSIARNALNGLPLSEYQVSVARRYLSTLPVNDRQTSDDVGRLSAIIGKFIRIFEMDGDDPRIDPVPLIQEAMTEARAALKGVPQPATPKESAMTEAQIKHMVDRFLMWKLPEHFNPDGGIRFEPVGNKGTPYEYRHDPVGTNLLSAEQATAMVRHMLEGVPQPASELNFSNDAERDGVSVKPATSSQPASSPIGYLYLNPDTGTEFSENHPVESGECDDAENIREATAESLRDALLEAWREREEAETDSAKSNANVFGISSTLREIEHLTKNALASLSQPASEAGKLSTDEVRG